MVVLLALSPLFAGSLSFSTGFWYSSASFKSEFGEYKASTTGIPLSSSFSTSLNKKTPLFAYAEAGVILGLNTKGSFNNIPFEKKISGITESFGIVGLGYEHALNDKLGLVAEAGFSTNFCLDKDTPNTKEFYTAFGLNLGVGVGCSVAKNMAVSLGVYSTIIFAEHVAHTSSIGSITKTTKIWLKDVKSFTIAPSLTFEYFFD